MTDNRTTKISLRFGQIWRTTIPGNLENAREIVSDPTPTVVAFVLRAPPGAQLAGGRTVVSVPEWERWVESHNAEPIRAEDMHNPPGREPRRY